MKKIIKLLDDDIKIYARFDVGSENVYYSIYKKEDDNYYYDNTFISLTELGKYLKIKQYGIKQLKHVSFTKKETELYTELESNDLLFREGVTVEKGITINTQGTYLLNIQDTTIECYSLKELKTAIEQQIKELEKYNN